MANQPQLRLVSSQEAIPEEAIATRHEIEADEYMAQAARHRQHGVDVEADQHRSETLGRLWTRAKYGAALLIAAAIVYEAPNVVGSQEAHAPQPPAHLANKLK